MKNLLITQAALSSLLLLAAPASAQEEPQQTPEGAHRFLEGLVAKGALLVKPSDDRETYTYSNGVRPTEFKPAETVIKVISLRRRDSCYSDIRTDVRRHRTEIIPRSRETRFTTTAIYHYVPEVLQLEAKGIDWRKVTRVVTTDGWKIDVESPSGSSRFVAHGDGATARTAYAMEFLRLSCDPTANTGF